MSKWDQYIIEEEKPSGKWDDYIIEEESAQDPEEDWSKLIAKSLASGALSFADLPVVLAGLAELGIDFAKGNKIETPKAFDYLPSNYLKQGIEATTGVDLNPEPQTRTGRLVSAGLQGLGGGIGGGGLAKLATKTALPKLGKALGAEQSLKSLGAAGAGVGTAAEGLQEAGLDPITSAIGASLAVPSTTSLLSRFPKNAIDKAQLYPLGLSPKKFDLDLYDASQRSGIELPAAAYTDAKLAHLANQVVGATPYFGDKVKAKNMAPDSKIKDKLANLLNKVGPEDTEETLLAIGNKYANAADLLPENATAAPIFTLPEAASITEDLAGVPYLSRGSEELNKIANKIYGGFNNPDHWRTSDLKVPVRNLIKQKQNINANQKVWADEADAIRKAQKIAHAINEDIGVYGLQNPEWHKTYKDADKFFGQFEQRKKLDRILGKGINEGTDSVSHANLAKAIHGKDKAKKIKEIVAPSDWQEVADLGAISRGMSRKNLNIPNPSGTTTTALANASGLGALYGAFKAPFATLGTLGAANQLTNLLTNQKYVDAAARFTREARSAKPKPSLKSDIKRRMEGLPGFSTAVEDKDKNRRKKIPTITIRNPNRSRVPEIDLPSVSR